jgi:hypothetical protein
MQSGPQTPLTAVGQKLKRTACDSRQWFGRPVLQKAQSRKKGAEADLFIATNLTLSRADYEQTICAETSIDSTFVNPMWCARHDDIYQAEFAPMPLLVQCLSAHLARSISHLNPGSLVEQVVVVVVVVVAAAAAAAAGTGTTAIPCT